MKWTTEQFRAITSTGTSLLVSAAAGSGKTAVLAERCAHLVCDAPQPCDVDQLLVVTFTNAAATEMRARIEKALRDRLNRSEDPRLTKQLLLLDRAEITTLHGFCQSLLRRHFDVLGIDPNFRVLDAEEVVLLKREIARELLDDHYDDDPGGEFHQFIEQYGTGDDEGILRRILALHELMGSIVDPDGWLRAAALRIAQAKGAKRLIDSELGKALAEHLREWMADLRGRWVRLATQVQRISGLGLYGEFINEFIAGIMAWEMAFAEGDFDALSKEIAQFDPGRLPTIKNPPPEKQAIQDAINAIRKAMSTDFCRFTEAEWQDGLAAIYSPAKVFVTLVREFRTRFAAAKQEMRGLDFNDLETMALRILRDKPDGAELTPSAIAQQYHRQFRHVLVDEYQDINAVQDAILTLISRECIFGEPKAEMNLFCVGDVKQSIYRFRLADPDRFLARYGRFTKPPTIGSVIDLSANFRSRGPLLNVINSVFERLMTQRVAGIEYDQAHRLQAGATYPSGSNGTTVFAGSPVELHLLPPPPKNPDAAAADTDLDADRADREAAFVAHRIADLMASKTHIADKSADGSLQLRPLRYGDIVILLRSMRYKSQQFADALRAAGIPVHSASATGFFESMEIRDMLALLHLLDNQQQDIPLAAVLRSPLSGLAEPEDSLARIRLAYPDSHAVPFHQAAVRYAQEQDDELAAQLRAFFRDLSQWRQLAHQRPLAEVLWHIYDSTGYLAFCAGMEDGQQRVANLIDFHARAQQFGTFQRQGLGRFMDFLESLAEESDLGQPSIASEADDVVRIMSIHRSKGLEFPVVFVPDLGKQHNLQDTAGSILIDRDAGIGLMVCDRERRIKYSSLAHVLVQDRIRRQTISEELRVLYVAMTRAREHLILVGSCEETDSQAWIEQWREHIGPLPGEYVLSGRRMIDWIGPVAAAMTGAGVSDRIEIQRHGEEEVAEWSAASSRRADPGDELMRLAALQPLAPAPPMHPQAAILIERLTKPYPFGDLSRLPASRSVGDLTKHGRAAPGGESESTGNVVSFDRELAAPRCVSAELTASPTDIGSATHLVLEHLDFSRACDLSDLRQQVANLVEKKLILPDLIEEVDLGAIEWLMSTPTGAVLRANAKTLRRELPVYFPMTWPDTTASNDPLDRVMVRGRIDMLVPDKSGLVLIDFKTDRVTSETVDARADFYRPQLASYSQAIAGITGIPVKSAILVFLFPRLIRLV